MQKVVCPGENLANGKALRKKIETFVYRDYCFLRRRNTYFEFPNSRKMGFYDLIPFELILDPNMFREGRNSNSIVWMNLKEDSQYQDEANNPVVISPFTLYISSPRPTDGSNWVHVLGNDLVMRKVVYINDSGDRFFEEFFQAIHGKK